jgi:hypothetical protein
LILVKDDIRLGIVLGLLAPFLGMLVFYVWKFYPTYTLADFFTILMIQRSLITAMVSFSLLANAILFTIYINTRRDRTAKGIFIITCIYAIAAIVYKMLL